jgi:DNA polymerase-1
VKRTILIDADILIVSGCAAGMKEFEGEDDEWYYSIDLKEVKNTLLNTVEQFKKELEATDAVLCISRGTTFRHRIFPTYKGGRGRKPLGVGEVKRWLVDDHGAKLKEGIEADDTLGILSTHPSLISGEKVIVSADKDLKTIPGNLYHGGQWLEIDEATARYNWLLQTLTGDTTDGYPGCPGLGAVTAGKLLDKLDIENEEEWWPAIVGAYENKKLDEEYALTQARCARILHYTDYDFKKKEAILWRPKSSL